MPLEILDSRVQLIVTLRKKGQSEDDIAAMTELFDSVDKASQTMLAKIVILEDPEVVKTLVKIFPDVRAALVRPNGKTAAEIIEEAAKPFLQPA